jgi:hypothetical protein
VTGVIKVTLVAVLAAAAAGCTALRLAYDNADTWLLFRVNSYLDLDARSSEELAERVDE